MAATTFAAGSSTALTTANGAHCECPYPRKGASDMQDVPQTTTLLRLATDHLMRMPAANDLPTETRNEIEVQQAGALALVAIGAELMHIRETLELLESRL
jgi:hypothetical protein